MPMSCSSAAVFTPCTSLSDNPIERARPAVKARVDVWGDPGPAADLMRAVKRAFDPRGIFAPGRFVGGL